jgi:hypothetical protein
MFSPGGGSGPKHSAFCGGCFSINPYRLIFGQKSEKSGQKNTEPSTFFNASFWHFLIKFDPYKLIFKYYAIGFNNSLPISIL